MSHARDLAGLQIYLTDDIAVKEQFMDSDTVVSSALKTLAASTGTKGFATPGDLPAGAAAGAQAYVTSNSRLYISNGSGWYNIALINQAPYWITQPDGSYSLSTTGAITSITILGADSDGHDIPQYSAAGDSGFNAIATVVKDSDNGRIFTVTPIDSEGAGSNVSGSGTLTFTLSDGKDSVIANSTFSISIQLVPEWSTSDSEMAMITATQLAAANGATANNMYLGYGGAAASYDGTYFAAAGTVGGTAQGCITWFKRTGSSLSIMNGTTMGQTGGRSCAMTSDGKITVVGADAVYNNNQHKIKIFKRANANSYNTSPVATISTPTYYSNNYFGNSVSISDSDENGTIWLAVGAYRDNSHKSGDTYHGKAHLYYSTNGGDTWTHDTAAANLLQGQVIYQSFGGQVEISKDAKYLFVSSPYVTYNSGTAQPIRIFTRSNTTWSETTSIPNPPYDPGANANSNTLDSDGTGKLFGGLRSFGQVIATDGTGSRLAVAGGAGHVSLTDFTPSGSGIYQSMVVRVYVRNGSTWTLEQRFESPRSIARLAAGVPQMTWGGEEYYTYFGTDGNVSNTGASSRTLDFSDNGKILVIGAPGEDSEGVILGTPSSYNGGAHYVYTYSDGSGWNHLTPAVPMPDYVGGSNAYGKSVPISGDGKWILGIAVTGYQPVSTSGSNVVLLKSDT